nr:immunoglobulin light chain junction region [Macaca mulatta]MOX52840.1 immunoglobulin light chain junction region [Macaca mulatta]MOX53559.1 immunoglobulin light chain junction region [Macaca mulatta]MOX53578.1 immunoglobulin light chain junction region [Macaca mulatta]MOX54127.1 immunoglobulin light chain junction region [Macaca mulatta]
CMQAFETPWTF